MIIEEIKKMSTEDLNSKVYSLKEEYFDLRRKKAVGQLENVKHVKEVRKDIARIYTVLNERKNGIK